MYSLSYHSDTAGYIISPLFNHPIIMYTDDSRTSSAYVFFLVKCQTVLSEMVLWTELPCVVHLCTFGAANWILQCCDPIFMSPSHSWVPVVKFESMSKSHDSCMSCPSNAIQQLTDAFGVWHGAGLLEYQDQRGPAGLSIKKFCSYSI